VPMARVQHVDTRRGPLQRRLGLSTVVFYTAAGPNEIPQLASETADEVRDRIAELTREADEL
jgi:membrane protein YdbS with pleckstrin-like domain